MALTPEQLQKFSQSLERTKQKQQSGYIPPSQVLAARSLQPDEDDPQTETNFIGRVKNSLLERAGEFKETFQQTAAGDISPVESAIRTVGDVAGGIGDIFGAAIEPAVKPAIEKIAQTRIGGAALEKLSEGMEAWEAWKQEDAGNERVGEMIEALVNIADLVGVAAAGKMAGKKLTTTGAEIVKGTGESVSRQIDRVRESGIGQKASELAERVPRAVERGRESLQEAQEKAAKIKKASPVIQQAYKAELDDPIIDFVVQSDSPTRKAAKEMVDIAKEPKKIGSDRRPEIVAGKAASREYEIVNNYRKKVGEDLGKKVQELSKTQKLDMSDSLERMKETLANQGVNVFTDDKGNIDFDFAGSDFSPAERTRVKELYNLATEGGNTLTPAQIHKKDRLFSKLQRESRFEGIGDILVDTVDGKKSVFEVFRDIFGNKLEDVSPEVKELNRKYREARQLIDDLDKSIVKNPNFQTIKNLDPSEAAQVNLRRIFSNAQSKGAYTEIAAIMDNFARQLGYDGPKPSELMDFALELNKIYPETIPKASFSGGVRLGVGDLVEKAMEVGKPGMKDQQKALEELINSLLK